MYHRPPTPSKAIAPQPPAENQITPENYDKIEIGMTYEEVVEIFGIEGNAFIDKPVNGEQIFSWMYATTDFAKGKGIVYKVVINFKDGKVLSKSYQDHL